MNITVWGNELPAWTAAAALAQSGNRVNIVTDLSTPELPSYMVFKASNEPGLQLLIDEEQQSGRLRTIPQDEGYQASVNFLALDPAQHGLAEQITLRLGQNHPRELLIINQSNFGVGSSDRLQSMLDESRRQCVVYMPDMLAEGSALNHFRKPETLIVGSRNDWALMNIRALMRPFTQSLKQWLIMSAREAEFTKFANTGMLALRLGYINELANLAEKLDVDIEVIRNGMISDPRIGPHYLHPGCGFGGQHFQQYIEALSELLEETRSSRLMETVLSENEKQKEQPFRKLWRHYRCDLQDRIVTIWGLSFKPGTASIDNAPSLKVIETLLAQGCQVHVHDPEACDNIRLYFGKRPDLHYFSDCYQALQGSDGLILLTEWNEYWSPDYQQMLSLMNQPLIIDGRNIFDKPLLQELGFTYYGTGR